MVLSQELGRRHDRNATPGMKDKKVLIAGNNYVSLGSGCKGENKHVIWVAARWIERISDHLIDLDNLGSLPDQEEKFVTVGVTQITLERTPVQDFVKFGEFLLADRNRTRSEGKH